MIFWEISCLSQGSHITIFCDISINIHYHFIFLDGVTADLSGTVSTSERNGLKYLHVDSLHLDLKVRDVRMQVSRVFNNNRILSKFPTLKTYYYIITFLVTG